MLFRSLLPSIFTQVRRVQGWRGNFKRHGLGQSGPCPSDLGGRGGVLFVEERPHGEDYDNESHVVAGEDWRGWYKSNQQAGLGLVTFRCEQHDKVLLEPDPGVSYCRWRLDGGQLEGWTLTVARSSHGVGVTRVCLQVTFRCEQHGGIVQ